MNQLYEMILKYTKKKAPLIIAIDGFGCSGKTTYADKISQYLQSCGKNSQIIHIDDFIKPRDIRYNKKFSLAECYYKIQFRYDYLKQIILEPIKNGKRGIVKAEIYNMQNDDYDIGEINLSVDVIIIEGVFLQRPELKQYFDFTIYIDIDRELQMQRALKRRNNGRDEIEIKNKYKEKYNPAEDYYLQMCNPKNNADIVIDARNETYYEVNNKGKGER